MSLAKSQAHTIVTSTILSCLLTARFVSTKDSTRPTAVKRRPQSRGESVQCSFRNMPYGSSLLITSSEKVLSSVSASFVSQSHRYHQPHWSILNLCERQADIIHHISIVRISYARNSPHERGRCLSIFAQPRLRLFCAGSGSSMQELSDNESLRGSKQSGENDRYRRTR